MKKDTEMIVSLISKIREKANTFINSELKRCNIEGLLPVHGDILYALMVHGELSMKEIAEIVDRKKSTVTTLIDKMVILGYVDKRKDESDNRYYIISLSQKGRKYRKQLIEISDNLIKKVYKDMPRKEREQLVQSLKKIKENW